MDLQLDGKVVVVTGGSAGIGRAAALVLAGEGCRLAVGARDEERLEKLASEVRGEGGEIVTVAGDLVESPGLDALVGAGRGSFGGVDALVACVGSTPVGDFDELTDDVWQRSFDMKFMATVRAMRAVLPSMRERGSGRIAVLAGNTAQDPTPWMATSGAINAALGNLVGSLARQYGAEGISVNCLSPGPTRTVRYEGMRSAVMDREDLEEGDAAAWIRNMIPDRHVGDPEEVGALVAYLVSPRSAHINGTTVVIDGGQTWPR